MRVLCQSFTNRTADTFEKTNLTLVQDIHYASLVLGYTDHYDSEPDFLYAHEEWVYDLGTDLDRSYHLIGDDLYFRTYSKGIVYYNSTSEQGYFEDGRTINSLDACFYLYNPYVANAEWRFNINQRDPTGSNGEYNFTQDWAVGTW